MDEYTLQFIYPRWTNKVLLYVTVKYQKYSFSSSSAELMDVDKPIFSTYRIFLGRYDSHEYEMAEQPTIYVPDEADSIFYKPTFKNYDEILKNTTLYDKLIKTESEFFLIVSFPKINDYLIKIKMEQEHAAVQASDVTISDLQIAVFSNPFLGFKPDDESLRSSFIGNGFYHVRNYDGIAYVINYKIDFSLFFIVSTIQ